MADIRKGRGLNPRQHITTNVAEMRANSNRSLSRGSLFGGQIGSNIGYGLTGAYHGADRKRNVWDQAGFPEIVKPEMLFNMYRRNGLAKGIVKLITDKTWQLDPVVYDGEVDPKRREEAPTEFELAVDKLVNSEKAPLWSRIKGADMRQQVMRYSGLFIIGKEQAYTKSNEEMSKLTGLGGLVNLKPCYESELPVTEFYQDTSEERYSQPKIYQYDAYVDGSRNYGFTVSMPVHESRIIPLAEGADDGSIYGVSVLEACYNSLLTYEKIETSGGEGFFRNACQKLAITFDPALTQGIPKDEQMDFFNDSIDSFYRDMNKTLNLAGATANPLQSNMASPEHYVAATLNSISAATGIPMTVLIGQQTGRLASDEDQSHMNVLIQSRQNTWGKMMIRTVLRRLVVIGVLPEPSKSIEVEWPDITEPSMMDKVAMAKTMMETNKIARDAGQDPVYSTEYIQERTGVPIELLPDLELPENEL